MAKRPAGCNSAKNEPKFRVQCNEAIRWCMVAAYPCRKHRHGGFLAGKHLQPGQRKRTTGS